MGVPDPSRLAVPRLRVRTSSNDEAAFIEEFGSFVAPGAVFLPSRAPRPVGSRVAFEVTLAGGRVMLSGEGAVGWLRGADEARGLGPGMGLRVESFSEASMAFLQRLVQQRETGSIPLRQEARPETWPSAPVVPEHRRTPSAPPILAPVLRAGPPPVACPPAAAPPPGATPSSSAFPNIPSDEPPGPPPASTGPALGPVALEFGTSEIRVALVGREGAVTVALHGEEGGLPSAAAWVEGQPVLGHRALDALESGTPGLRGPWSLLGLAEDSPSPGAPPVEESAERLVELAKARAEARLGGRITEVVAILAVDAPSASRARLKEILSRRGVDRVRFVSPSAAALMAFGELRGRVLSVAIGAGAVEASVLECSDDQVRMLTSAIDRTCGTDDLDRTFGDALLDRFEAETQLEVPRDSSAAKRVRLAASGVRVLLSRSLEEELLVPGVAVAGLATAELRLRVTRALLLSLAGPWMERIVRLARGGLAELGLGVADLSGVVVTGAPSGMGALVRRLGDRLGHEPMVHPRASQAAVLGAAALAAGFPGGLHFQPCLGATLSVGLPGGALRRLAGRGSPLPTTSRYVAITRHDEQVEISMHLFQGEATSMDEGQYVGSVVVGPLRRASRGEVAAEVTFLTDSDGLLAVSAREAGAEGRVEARFAVLPWARVRAALSGTAYGALAGSTIE